jgi:uncharacterized tellurite resistance protein B-like protein
MRQVVEGHAKDRQSRVAEGGGGGRPDGEKTETGGQRRISVRRPDDRWAIGWVPVALRRNATKPRFRRRERPNRRLGVPGVRLGGEEQRQDRRFSLGSGGSPEYDSGLRSNKWEIPGQGLGMSPSRCGGSCMEKAKVLATLKVLLAASKADGRIEEREWMMMQPFVESIGLNPEDLDSLIKQPVRINRSDLPSTAPERRQLLEQLAQLVLVNGTIDDREIKVIKIIIGALNLSDSEVMNCWFRAQSAVSELAKKGQATEPSIESMSRLHTLAPAALTTDEPTNCGAPSGKGERWVWFLIPGQTVTAPGTLLWAEFEVSLMQFLSQHWGEDDLSALRSAHLFRAYPTPPEWERQSDRYIILNTVQKNLPSDYKEEQDWTSGIVTVSSFMGMQYPFVLVRSPLLPPVRVRFRS